MAKQFLIEIENFGTKDNLSFIKSLINPSKDIFVDIFIEDEYRYDSYEFKNAYEKAYLTISLILPKKATLLNGVLAREIIIDKIDKAVTESFVVRGDDDDRYFQKTKGENSYKIFINQNRYIYFDKSEISLFFRWAFKKGMLLLQEEELKKRDFIIENDLIYDFVKREYVGFVVFYIAKINYDSHINIYSDLGDLFPKIADFKDIKDTNKLLDMFEKAYGCYSANHIITVDIKNINMENCIKKCIRINICKEK